MPGQERLKDRLKNTLNHLHHSLVPCRSRASSNRPITLDSQASAGFEGVKTTLRLIERATDVFPPLKSTVAGLLGVIDILETTAQNHRDCQDLEQKLRAVVSVIDNHANDSTTPTFTTRLEGLSKAMNYQLNAIKTKRNRPLASRIATGSADAGDITVAYRTLSYLFDAFLMDITLEIRTTMHEIRITTHEIRTITQRILSNAMLSNLPLANRAAYDTKSPAGRRSCTAKTREEILADLIAWAADAGDTKIYWLNGMAGTGKTTIAFTFSEILDDIQVLGASFFCSYLDTESSNADLIFPTLAYELARHSTAASNALLNALEKDRNVGRKSLRDQFVNLIVTPTNAASEGVSALRPLIIVIDALDECAHQSDVSEMLAIICQYSPDLPLKFLITSRPERQIQNVFRQEGTSRYSKFILHEIDKDIVSADIAIYAREELALIAKGRMAGMPISGWPPEDRLNTLVRLSGRLFIHAATACKYVGGGGSIVERLEDVTDVSPNSPDNDINETSALDDLYGRILSAAFKRANAREEAEIQKVLRAVTSVHTPLSINGLSKLLEIKAENVSEALSSLHSVVCVPENAGLPISMFHTSFTDFITTKKRSKEHFLEPSESHQMLGLHCLRLLQPSLMENIQLEGLSGSLNMDDSPSTVTDQTLEAFVYACINWATHVAGIKSGGEVAREVCDALSRFLDEKLLQWFECLSHLTQLGEAVSSLKKLEAWVPVCGYSISMRIMAEQQMKNECNLQNAVVDARRFILENFELVRHHPLEIYSSALVWLPEESLIRMKYGDKRKSTWKVVIGLRKVWDACEQVLWGHLGSVNSVAFSPDGRHVVSGSNDNTVRIWNVATGESKAELKGHSGNVSSVAFSPDSSRVVSGSDDSTVHIWNVATGESEAELREHSSHVCSVIFSPDGSRVAFGSLDNTVHIWNVDMGKSEVELRGHLGKVYCVIFSPDSSCVVSGSDDSTVRIWNVAMGETKKELRGHMGSVYCVVFSPDGSRVVSGSSDSTVRIWNVERGESEAELRGHSTLVSSVAFSPDGRHVVSGSFDNTVHIWNVATGESEAELKGHLGSVHSVVFSPDGSHVVSGSADLTVRIWDVATGETKKELSGHWGSVNSVIFSPDGSRVVSGTFDKTVHIWNVETGESEAELRGHSILLSSVVFSPDGRHVVSGLFDNTLQIWNVETGESKAELRGHLGSVYSVVFSPDGSRVASGSLDNTVRIWNIVTGVSEAELKGHSGSVNSVVFSPDGKHVVSGSFDQTVCIWNAMTGESEAKLIGHSGSVYSVVFSPDGHHVVSGSSDNTLRIWNVATHESEAELKGHSGSVHSVVFSPDGRCVVSGSNDNTLRIWNVATHESKAELKGHSGSVHSVVFSPDGNHVVSGSADHTVRIWNAASGETEKELSGHWGSVNSVIFSPDGNHVMSESADSTTRIWNIATGASLVHSGRTLQLLGTPSLHLDFPWIVHTGSGLHCWLPPQYRNIQTITSHTTFFCIGLKSGLVLAVRFCCSDPPNALLT